MQTRTTFSRMRCFIGVNILQWVKSINRHGASCTFFLAVLLLCLISHSIARSMIALLSDVPSAYLQPRLLHNVAGIQFIDTNWLIAVTYLFLFFGALVYMEIRATPRWAVWSTFLILTLPLVAYIILCVRVGTRFFVIAAPTFAP
jgi:hypothetical protein